MMLLRLAALAALLYAAYALVRRNRWTVRERQALILIAAATALIVAAAVALVLLQGGGRR